ncbi:MAG: DNA methyltransferase [Clostridia bacterium]|nr:DNA methyltransferase [Clostridia bacterium]
MDYINENVKLLCGDCLEVMKQIPDKSIDLIITDPPYELDTHGGGDRVKWKNIHNKFIDEFSCGFEYENVFNEFMRICKTPNILIFCSNKQISKIMSWFENKKLSTTLICWHKEGYIPFSNGKHMSDVEFIVYVRAKNAHWNNSVDSKLKSKVIKSNWRIHKKLHPTQKSIEIMEHLINLHSFENDIVLDAFMGSGTTGVACMNLNRKFIGIELDENYFEIAKNRILKDI